MEAQAEARVEAAKARGEAWAEAWVVAVEVRAEVWAEVWAEAWAEAVEAHTLVAPPLLLQTVKQAPVTEDGTTERVSRVEPLPPAGEPELISVFPPLRARPSAATGAHWRQRLAAVCKHPGLLVDSIWEEASWHSCEAFVLATWQCERGRRQDQCHLVTVGPDDAQLGSRRLEHCHDWGQNPLGEAELWRRVLAWAQIPLASLLFRKMTAGASVGRSAFRQCGSARGFTVHACGRNIAVAAPRRCRSSSEIFPLPEENSKMLQPCRACKAR